MSHDYTDLIKRLLLLSLHSHDDLTIGIEAADAIAALVAERDALKASEAHGLEKWQRLLAERDAAVADAQRLEWLWRHMSERALRILLGRDHSCDVKEMRSAIDYAIAKETP